jgi:hypothetical protein
MAAAAHVPNPTVTDQRVVALDDNIIVELDNEFGVISVTGPNKVRIDVFDASWQLVVSETNCSPITVYVNISGEPDGDYWVRVTTTTGTVTEMVTKG